MSRASRALVVALALAAGCACAQEAPPANGVLLVARPDMRDPNFARAVVLVTQAEDGHTLGVILNRPTREQHEQQPLWFGGPVFVGSIIALFVSREPPEAPAFHVLKNVYLTMHPLNVDALLADASARFRLYTGFAAWAPRQLAQELERDAWYVLPAQEEQLFQENMDGLWEELVAQAEGPRT